MIKVNKRYISLYVILPLLVYLSSYVLLSRYYAGDQFYYRLFYEVVSGSSFVNSLSDARSILGSIEPVSVFVLWLGSVLDFPKDHWVAILNVILIVSVCRFLWLYNVSWYIYLLTTTNFYTIVLMTGAERLKIAYILILVALNSRKLMKLGAGFIAPLCHFQIILAFYPYAFFKTVGVFKKIVSDLSLDKLTLLFFSFTSIFLIIYSVYAYELLLFKLDYYYGDHGFSSLYSLFLLALVAVLSDRKNTLLVASILLFIPVVLLLGPDRTNIIAFSVFFWHLTVKRRISGLFPTVLLMYLSVKSVFFVYNIFVYGNGFGGYLF